MSQVNTLREIALSRAIDGQLNEIVQAAGALAAQLQGSGMRENQLRNALNVALHTDSMEVVGNYIRYQIGRGGGWRDKDFGEKVIAAMGSRGIVYQTAKTASSDALAQLKAAHDNGKLGSEGLPSADELTREAHVQLCRRFLGYLNRWFLYADREKAWGKIAPMVETTKEATA